MKKMAWVVLTKAKPKKSTKVIEWIDLVEQKSAPLLNEKFLVVFTHTCTTDNLLFTARNVGL